MGKQLRRINRCRKNIATEFYPERDRGHRPVRFWVRPGWAKSPPSVKR